LHFSFSFSLSFFTVIQSACFFQTTALTEWILQNKLQAVHHHAKELLEPGCNSTRPTNERDFALAWNDFCQTDYNDESLKRVTGSV
jgi:hypothetical protein